jgi:hypothetical protein
MKKKTLLLLIFICGVFFGSTAFAGLFPPTGVTPDVAVAWATYVVGSANQGTADNILGAVDGSWAVGNPGGGWITVGFDRAITNRPGADFAVWENSFGTAPLSYAELGYVDVSTDGVNWVEFPSIFFDDGGNLPNYVDVTDVYNLAGSYWASYMPDADKQGVPFDLDDIMNTPEVLAGLVDPYEINFVRIRDIIGAGEGGSNYDQATYFGYANDNLIYDAISYGGGADWDAVGVINAVPVPGAIWLLGSGLLALLGIRRKTSA